MSPNLQIRQLTAADAAQYRPLRLAALQERPPAFGMPLEEFTSMSDEALAKWLEPKSESHVLGAFIGEDLVGTIRYSRFHGSNEKHRAYIAGFYVAPDFRGKGIGRQLLQTILDHVKTLPNLRILALSVVSTQEPAIQLYKSLGFTQYATQREAFECDGNYYDEHLMEISLVDAD